MIRLLLSCFFLYLCNFSVYADEVIWKGKVDSNGFPTEPITLKIHDRYQIKVSRFINLGKWVQASEKLANDACYEFNDKLRPSVFESFKNSQNIPVCDDTYHDNHVYFSEPFVAKQNRIFFWVYDSDYDDNNGAFDVEIIHKTKSISESME